MIIISMMHSKIIAASTDITHSHTLYVLKTTKNNKKQQQQQNNIFNSKIGGKEYEWLPIRILLKDKFIMMMILCAHFYRNIC